MMQLSIDDIKNAFGCGDISSDRTKINVPGPNHSKHNRSLSVILAPETPDGFSVNSWAGEDFGVCKDYVRQKLGLPAFGSKGGAATKRSNSGWWLSASDQPTTMAAKRGNLEGFIPSKLFSSPTTTAPPSADISKNEYAGGFDDLPEAPHAHPSLGIPTLRHEYRDHLGRILGYVCRFDPSHGKSFIPLTPWASEKGVAWSWKGFPTPRPIYGLSRLFDRPGASVPVLGASVPVLIVEGEKTADAAQDLFPDFVVITSQNGANARRWPLRAVQANRPILPRLMYRP